LKTFHKKRFSVLKRQVDVELRLSPFLSSTFSFSIVQKLTTLITKPLIGRGGDSDSSLQLKSQLFKSLKEHALFI